MIAVKIMMQNIRQEIAKAVDLISFVEKSAERNTVPIVKDQCVKLTVKIAE